MNRLSHGAPCLSRPYIVGYMSVDVHRQYHADLSQLKYVTCIPKGRVEYDLNHNLDKAVKRTTADNEEKIMLLLKFLLDQEKRLSPPHFAKVHFISYRRVLISVLYSAFYVFEPVDIAASFYKGTIYLCGIQSPEDVASEARNKQDHKFCAWGYKFEQYLSADLPSTKPDIEKPVIENEEFSMCYYAVLGNHQLLCMAQIDGMMATDNTVPDPPKTADVETNLNYLRDKSYVELKTNRKIDTQRQEYNFKRNKLLKCWAQCYLAGLSGLLVGFRDDHGIIHSLKWFSTNDIVDYCKNVWDPQEALHFLDSFLHFVKCSFKNHIVKCGVTDPINLKFRINKDRTFKVLSNDSDDFIILPEWYYPRAIRMGRNLVEVNRKCQSIYFNKVPSEWDGILSK